MSRGIMLAQVGELAKLLRIKRIQLKKTQQEMATALNYSSKMYISNWERNVSSPPLNRLADICRVYKIPKSHILEIMTANYSEKLKELMNEKTK